MSESQADRRGSAITRQAEQICALGAAAIGALAGASWILGKPQSLALGSTDVPVAPISALLFLLLGISVFAFSRWPLAPLARRTNVIFVPLILALSLLLGGETLFGLDPTIENWIVSQSTTASGMIIGRLSPVSAGSFLLATAALFCQWPYFSTRPASVYISLAACWSLFLICEVTLTGYAFGIPPVFSTARIPMALLSAAAFALLATSLSLRALVFVRRLLLPHNMQIGRYILRYFMVAVICVAVAVVLRTAIAGNYNRGLTFLTFYPAVTIAALYGGIPGGLLATVLSGMYSQVVIKSGVLSGLEWTALAMYLLSCTMISVICEVMLQHRHRTARMNKQLEAEIVRRKMDEVALLEQFDVMTRAKNNLEELNKKLVQAQDQLLQSEKMSAIGQLAAGIAHEINNPVSYVNSNLGTLQKYMADIFVMLDKYEAAEKAMDRSGDALNELAKFKKTIDLDYLRNDILGLLAESHDGLERVKKIVLDMKSFSHAHSADEWEWADLHAGLESTLNVVWNELKYKCEIRKEYGDLPQVYCLPSQLNQVFMNLLVNAAQAIDVRGVITLRTGRENDRVWIEIADTGKGIPEEDIPRIFEPFFSTKPVGKGTGLGLSVSYNVVKKHHGEIEVKSEADKGTTFRIWIPAKQPVQTAAEGAAK